MRWRDARRYTISSWPNANLMIQTSSHAAFGSEIEVRKCISRYFSSLHFRTNPSTERDPSELHTRMAREEGSSSGNAKEVISIETFQASDFNVAALVEGLMEEDLKRARTEGGGESLFWRV